MSIEKLGREYFLIIEYTHLFSFKKIYFLKKLIYYLIIKLKTIII